MSIPQTPHVLSTLVVVSAIAFVLLATTAGRSAGVPAPAAGDAGSPADQASRTRRSSELAAYGPGYSDPDLDSDLDSDSDTRIRTRVDRHLKFYPDSDPNSDPDPDSDSDFEPATNSDQDSDSDHSEPIFDPNPSPGLRPGRSSELAGYGEGEPVESGLDKRIGRLASWGKKNDMSWLDRAASKAIRSKWSNRNMAVWGKRADDNKRVKWSGNTLAAWG